MSIPQILIENEARLKKERLLHKAEVEKHKELVEYIKKVLPSYIDISWGHPGGSLYLSSEGYHVPLDGVYILKNLTPDNIYDTFAYAIERLEEICNERK